MSETAHKLPRLFGKYYLLELINVGGMAEVFKAKMFGVEGFEKIGIADMVFLRGKLMAKRGKLVAEKGGGKYIKPKPFALCYQGVK